MSNIKINNETLSRRCEICHQMDFFNPETNVCKRCEGLENIIILNETAKINEVGSLFRIDYAPIKVYITFLIVGFSTSAIFITITNIAYLEEIFFYKEEHGISIPNWKYLLILGCFYFLGLIISYLISIEKQKKIISNVEIGVSGAITSLSFLVVYLVGYNIWKNNETVDPTLVLFFSNVFVALLNSIALWAFTKKFFWPIFCMFILNGFLSLGLVYSIRVVINVSPVIFFLFYGTLFFFLCGMWMVKGLLRMKEVKG